MATKYNIKDWYRGTTPPWQIVVTNDDGSPYNLVGCRVVLVVRQDEWEDSHSDENALIKVASTVREVQFQTGLGGIENPRVGDITWVSEDDSAWQYNGTNWVQVKDDENNVIEGHITLRFTREQTMIPVDTYNYSIDIVYPNEEVHKMLFGKFRILPNTVNEV